MKPGSPAFLVLAARRFIQRSGSLATLAISLVLVTTGMAQVIYNDDFNDNTNTGWTYLDRSGGTALMTTIGGGPGVPSFVEQNGRVEQTNTNYSFPRDLLRNDATIGGLALSGSGVITEDHYAISADFTSLEAGNNNQDHSLVFACDASRRQYFGFLDSGRYSQQRCCVLNPDDRTHNHG